MKLSLVLIIYRSDSSIAQEASKFCQEVLKAKNIKSKRIQSDFHKDEIEKCFSNSECIDKGSKYKSYCYPHKFLDLTGNTCIVTLFSFPIYFV